MNPDGESRRPAIPRIEWALGSGLGAAAKPLFALVVGPIPILGSRFVDRIGKGLRGAPCDALVADVTPPEIRGRAYGLRQSLDTVGAFAGIALLACWLWPKEECEPYFTLNGNSPAAP